MDQGEERMSWLEGRGEKLEYSEKDKEKNNKMHE
jgi:hypothetical protein